MLFFGMSKPSEFGAIYNKTVQIWRHFTSKPFKFKMLLNEFDQYSPNLYVLHQNNSNNTRRLNLEETKEKIASLSYIQEELEKMNTK